MFLDRQHRVISCHDTWISIDPVVGCPFSCGYCVLRHSSGTGRRPEARVSPQECVDQLLAYPLFVRGTSRLAIGNETDMLHSANVDYLVELLEKLREAAIDNGVALITKAPLDGRTMTRIRAVQGLRIIFCLSYSGLGRRVEPNFSDELLRANFGVARAFGFPILHFWRPLLPENTTVEAIETMLSFVSKAADASMFVGLKVHPELTEIVSRDGGISVPESLRENVGEWLDAETIERVYRIASRICPAYPLYRHTSCALARIMRCPNHTGTVYREDICAPSHCPDEQRRLCEASRCVPGEERVARTFARLGRSVTYSRSDAGLFVWDRISQEEYSYLVQDLSCPVTAKAVEMQNLYYGSMHEGHWQPPRPATGHSKVTRRENTRPGDV